MITSSQYKNGKHYSSVFTKLVDLEREYCMREESAKRLRNLTVKCYTTEGKQHGTFTVKDECLRGLNLVPGDRVTFKRETFKENTNKKQQGGSIVASDVDWLESGCIFGGDGSLEVTKILPLEFEMGTSTVHWIYSRNNVDCTVNTERRVTKVACAKLWDGTCYVRMKQALESFAAGPDPEKLSYDLHLIFLGKCNNMDLSSKFSDLCRINGSSSEEDSSALSADKATEKSSQVECPSDSTESSAEQVPSESSEVDNAVSHIDEDSPILEKISSRLVSNESPEHDTIDALSRDVPSGKEVVDPVTHAEASKYPNKSPSEHALAESPDHDAVDALSPTVDGLEINQNQPSTVQKASPDNELSNISVETSIPFLVALNESQKEAIQHALRGPLTLIQGPPGTGKTTTCTAIVYHMEKLMCSRILVASPSNVAVDHIAERLAKCGLHVVRVYAQKKESSPQCPKHPFALHVLVDERLAGDPRYQKWKRKRKARKERSTKRHRSTNRETQDERNHTWRNFLLDFDDDSDNEGEEQKIRELIRETENSILEAARVICTTCSGAADTRLSLFSFSHVLIDEATQACEPETLIPLVKGTQCAVLIGDHKQLGPTVLCREAEQKGLGGTLFERLLSNGMTPHMLRVQYRMHPAIAAFPAQHFYAGELHSKEWPETYGANCDHFPWPNTQAPVVFVHTFGPEDEKQSDMCPTNKSKEGRKKSKPHHSHKSPSNRNEAVVVRECVMRLLKGGVGGEQIAVITPYSGQRGCVLGEFQSTMKRSPFIQAKALPLVEVNTVDAFQGREKEYVVLSCVRSSRSGGIGFLADRRRMNVALTRAQEGLIIIGDKETLGRDRLWSELLSYCDKLSVLVQGSLSKLEKVRE